MLTEQIIDGYLKNTSIGQIQDIRLRNQILDWTINSGPHVVAREIQSTLGTETDSILNPATLDLINKANPHLLGNALVAARIRMICRVIQKNPSQLKSLLSLCSRALEFLN